MRKNGKEVTKIWGNLREETRRGILSVVFFVLAIIFILASFNKAGYAGANLHRWLTFFLGIGYFLLPLVFLMLGITFAKSSNERLPVTKILGSMLFIISGLGVIDITHKSDAGVAGRLISEPLMKVLDVYGSVVILLALFVISILIIFETKLSIDPLKNFWKNLTSPKSISAKKQTLISGEVSEYGNIAPALPEKGEADKEIENSNENDEDGRTFRNRNDGSSESEEFYVDKKSPLFFKNLGKVFIPPPLTLLERDKGKPIVGDINANKNIIKRTLANFGINVEMDEISIGPSVTRYALKPAEGVKLSRIVALQNDLALALPPHPIHI